MGAEHAGDRKNDDRAHERMSDSAACFADPVPSAATQAASSLRGAASSSHNAVNQLLKSVVRKNFTLRSVGAGDG
jgi:hypothetical protein